MFGDQPLSGTSVSEQGIAQLGVAEQDANFTGTSTANVESTGTAEMSALGFQTAVGVGTLVGSSTMTSSAEMPDVLGGFIFGGQATLDANFTETSAANRVRVFSATQIANFTQSSAGSPKFVGVSTQDANFTSSGSGELIIDGQATVDANFTGTTAGIRVQPGIAEMSGNVVQTSTAIYITSADIDANTFFEQTPAATAKFVGTGDIIASFEGTSAGALLWTEVNASSNIETWTEKVV